MPVLVLGTNYDPCGKAGGSCKWMLGTTYNAFSVTAGDTVTFVSDNGSHNLMQLGAAEACTVGAAGTTLAKAGFSKFVVDTKGMSGKSLPLCCTIHGSTMHVVISVEAAAGTPSMAPTMAQSGGGHGKGKHKKPKHHKKHG